MNATHERVLTVARAKAAAILATARGVFPDVVEVDHTAPGHDVTNVEVRACLSAEAEYREPGPAGVITYGDTGDADTGARAWVVVVRR